MDMSQGLHKIKAVKLNLDNIQVYRDALGENQTAFWSRFGVTQSGGSRYESGRNIPKPVRLLIALHASGKLSDEDLRLAAGGKAKRGRTAG